MRLRPQPLLPAFIPRLEPRRAASLAFATPYGASGLFLALASPAHGAAALWAFIAWPFYFARLSQAGTAALLLTYAAVAAYVGWLTYRRTRPPAPDASTADALAAAYAQLAQCRERGRQAVRERDLALQRLAEAEEAIGGELPTGQRDGRFAAAKIAFARLHHPDAVQATGLERTIRGEVFRQFWQELEAIDRRAKQTAGR